MPYFVTDHIADEHELACDAVLSFLQHPDGSHHPKMMEELLDHVAKRCGPIVEVKKATGDYDALFSIYCLLTGKLTFMSDIIILCAISECIAEYKKLKWASPSDAAHSLNASCLTLSFFRRYGRNTHKLDT